MKKSALSNEPQNVGLYTWYYEEPKGLLVVHQVRTPEGDLIQAEQFVIPWKLVSASMRRYRKAVNRP